MGDTQSDNPGQSIPPLPWRSLRPYFTVTVLEYSGDVPERACEQVLAVLLPDEHRNERRATSLVSVGELAVTDESEAAFLTEADLAEVHGFVRRVTNTPGWQTDESAFLDVRHLLTLVLRRDRLVAIHTDDGLGNRLQRGLDRPPRPAFRRVPAPILETALLQGEAKGLWLRGTHARQANKPDTKNLSGQRLDDAFNPLEDSSFAMAAGRAALHDDPARSALVGTVGTTPRKSLVWLKRSTDWRHFLAITTELLQLLEKNLAGPMPNSPVFPLLAREVHDLTEVYGAFEMSALAPEDLPAAPDVSDEIHDAADTLQRATLDVDGSSTSSRLCLDVALDGVPVGKLKAQLEEKPGGFTASFGLDGTPSDEPQTREVLRALEYPNLVTIYYRSGHAFVDGQLWQRNTQIARFPHWRFEDFAGFNLAREKPTPDKPQDIHDAIGDNGDTSLFGWVVAHYREGWLTCDDGPGEIADFIHVAPSGTLTMIHVKSTKRDSRTRRVSAAAYEGVSGQAAKNLVYTNHDRLRERLLSPPVARPASWTHGQRTPHRDDFINAVNLRDITAPIKIVIIQPHLSEGNYQRLRDTGEQREISDDFLRLCLLETMLNTTRAAAVAVGADLDVVSSKR
jgi:hypothetical protein